MKTRSQTKRELSFLKEANLDQFAFESSSSTKNNKKRANETSISEQNAQIQAPPKKRQRISKSKSKNSTYNSINAFSTDTKLNIDDSIVTKLAQVSKEAGAMSSASSKTSKSKTKSKITIKYDESDALETKQDDFESMESGPIKDCDFGELTQDMIDEFDSYEKMRNGSDKNSDSNKDVWFPNEWIDMYRGILEMRSDPNGMAYGADVDRVGCACLSDPNASMETQRFHVLVGLLLSSQTKDPVTDRAVQNLKENFDGLTVDAIANCDNIKDIDAAICKVGFHNRKAEYLKKTAVILRDKYNGDVPKTVEELCALPGIGPKMAYICMQVAWKQNLGIGVDVHVHRIANLIGWTRKDCKSPEHTRKELESWVPKPLWPGINRLLVGFGQTVCLPRKPRCLECKVNHLCRVGQKAVKDGENPIVTKPKGNGKK